ncbi:hypothetical protein GS597_20020 [Synechococcales cyanobacterium C]|uniref:Uncharacterized protein n=1 Tax=Petrachloros mirabilis ULC683 TaxID=2781853 RepID=A0A8K2A2P7_9CYAN|nr:hypothetical protein [Petrachloros mirabilis]NCJ08753.1 hypothetical protein [Petrachloros mirabilis ULC683]
MTYRKRNPNKQLEAMINKNVKFQTAEMIAVVAAGAGSIASAFLGNAIYAAAPLTICAALNLFSRRQLDQLNRQHILTEVSEVQGELSTEFKALNHKLQDIPGFSEVSGLDQVRESISSLYETVAALEVQVQSVPAESVNLSGFESEFAELQNRQLDLAQSLDAVNQQLRTVATDSSESGVPVVGVDPMEIEALKAAIATLEQQVQQPSSSDVTPTVDLDPIRNDLRNELQGMINSIQAQMAAFEEHMHSQPLQAEMPVNQLEQVDSLRELVNTLQHQVGGLEQRVGQPTGASHDQVAQVQQLQGQVEGLNSKIDSALAQLSAEIAGFQNVVERTEGNLQGLQQNLTSVQQEAASTPAVDIQSELAATLNPLREQLSGLEQKLNTIPVTDPNLVQSQTQQLGHLHSQLDTLSTRIDNVSSQLHGIPTLVEETVQQQVEAFKRQQPAAVSPQNNKLAELDDILSGLDLG